MEQLPLESEKRGGSAWGLMIAFQLSKQPVHATSPENTNNNKLVEQIPFNHEKPE